MSRSNTKQDAWDQIFEDLILDSEPPTRYIKDAVIITKNGSRFKVSPDDFANIVAREKQIDPDQSDIQSCSLSIDFANGNKEVQAALDAAAEKRGVTKPATAKTKVTAQGSKAKATAKKATPKAKPAVEAVQTPAEAMAKAEAEVGEALM